MIVGRNVMKNRSKFIITHDKETANKLINCGFNLIVNNNGIYTFDNKLQNIASFNDIDTKKIVYTNMLIF